MTGREWIDAFAGKLGVEPPDDATLEALLDLAGVAAHGSERIAAPVACWLIGRAGVSVEVAGQLATGIGVDTAADG